MTTTLVRWRSPSWAKEWAGPCFAVFLYLLWTDGLAVSAVHIGGDGFNWPRGVAVFSSVAWALWNWLWGRLRLRGDPVPWWLFAAVLVQFIPTAVIAVGRDHEESSWLYRSMFWSFSFAVYFGLAGSENRVATARRVFVLLLGLATGISILAIGTHLGFVQQTAFSADALSRRGGELRLPFPMEAVLIWMLPAVLTYVITGTSWRLRLGGLVFVCLNIYHCAALSQMRQPLVVLLLALAIAAVIATRRRVVTAIILILCTAGCIGLGVLQSRLASSAVEEVLSEGGTVGLRIKGIRYHWPYFIGTYGLGYGVYSSTDGPMSYVKQGWSVGYNHNDYGLIGVLLQYGINGCVLVLFSVSYSIRRLRCTRNGHQSRWRPGYCLNIGVTSALWALLLMPTYNAFLLKPSDSFSWALLAYMVSTLMRPENLWLKGRSGRFHVQPQNLAYATPRLTVASHSSNTAGERIDEDLLAFGFNRTIRRR